LTRRRGRSSSGGGSRRRFRVVENVFDSIRSFGQVRLFVGRNHDAACTTGSSNASSHRTEESASHAGRKIVKTIEKFKKKKKKKKKKKRFFFVFAVSSSLSHPKLSLIAPNPSAISEKKLRILSKP
jgi:hypothetical protein